MAGPVTIQTVLYVALTGLIPSVVWLIFWLRRDRTRPEPFGLLLICFLLGAVGVVLAIPLQKFVQSIVTESQTQIILWATIEEVLKFLPVALIALRSKYNDEAIDPAMYMIVSALGFATLENIAYALQPAQALHADAALLNGSLRFLGATLLHVVSSGFVGIVIGLAPRLGKFFFSLFGLAAAIFLHSTFNFFIMKNASASFVQVYGYLWVAAIITLVTLEKLRRIPPYTSVPAPTTL
ncbi:MAG TPA: PrsW family glutamic-type intramembrane protease [Candidatus Paceibacterota bacterium]|nr:PrsW family glutamic-type intramembrane protease [Candidatus Paceibacterota bacterium]